MKKTVDTRLPGEIGKGALPEYPAVSTPWNKLISFYDAYHWGTRHNAAVGALFFEVIRILFPDYDERMTRLCKVNREAMIKTFNMKVGNSDVKTIHAENNCIYPFMKGGFPSALYGDIGDDRLLYAGRVNDFGTYRAEKELDTCDWDILGSEICRISPYSQTGIAIAYGEPLVEFHMVEALGCGDAHCRLIAENKEKHPMPEPEKIWDNMSPCATMDYIKVTTEENSEKEVQQFSEACNFMFRSGTDLECTPTDFFKAGGASLALGSEYVLCLLQEMIDTGEITVEKVKVLIENVFEGAGKMMFAEFFAKKGLREWLGVPAEINDGRVLGAYIEVQCQCLSTPYTVVDFNKDEVTYDITLAGIERRRPLLTFAYVNMWYGMVKTLVGSRWFFWRETEDVPEGILRVKIARKIDKQCR
ncbi:hypothetical protein AGMMS49983_14950 [Clostridia bacterium]|nr:hypothetical protein AGMMS49983_14950 [Clostridia bacterium]